MRLFIAHNKTNWFSNTFGRTQTCLPRAVTQTVSQLAIINRGREFTVCDWCYINLHLVDGKKPKLNQSSIIVAVGQYVPNTNSIHVPTCMEYFIGFFKENVTLFTCSHSLYKKCLYSDKNKHMWLSGEFLLTQIKCKCEMVSYDL